MSDTKDLSSRRGHLPLCLELCQTSLRSLQGLSIFPFYDERLGWGFVRVAFFYHAPQDKYVLTHLLTVGLSGAEQTNT